MVRRVSAPTAWTSSYVRQAALADFLCALAAGLLALELRFGVRHYEPLTYLAFTGALPFLWCSSVALFGGYDTRLIGVGSDEFRKVLNSAVSLTAAVAILCYATKTDFARSYVVIAFPTATLSDLCARELLRKRLHRLRRAGRRLRRVIAVGHTAAIADLVQLLRRDSYHGLSVVGACAAEPVTPREVAGVPVLGGLEQAATAVERLQADTVAVLACPEMSGVGLRDLAWELERAGTDLFVAPALLDVAGPRTTIRPIAGLPLLHMEHPELSGGRRLIKEAFDRVVALSALIMLSPVFVVVVAAIWIVDGRPVFFRQTRIGRHGRAFTLYKFRTMVSDAEARKKLLTAQNEGAGALFKIRRDPRRTRTGGWLRRWSVDELPQLVNVMRGDMSLVGPRPALPEEAARYSYAIRRRLAVKPGITGLWQVNGRSDLPWDEAVRLDLRYVENWSFVLDLQILWKTRSAIWSGTGAY
ncbi:MAG: sugar transferase [Actinobacteria bacterium]|nr:sugar transferase [Actinomycetota bacterium]MBO0814577.1 sugar transferase [Actinomycetota bacterium]